MLQRIRPRASASRRVVLANLVQEVAAWLRAQHAQHDVEVESPLSNRAILGDAVGLQQMVLNLGKNAVESLPPEGGKVWIAVREIRGETSSGSPSETTGTGWMRRSSDGFRALLLDQAGGRWSGPLYHP